MNRTATQYQAANRPLTAILAAVPADGWANPSPCDGWSVRDVVGHMIETQRDFLSGNDVDMGAPPDVDTDPATAWRHHAERVAEAISADAVAATEYDGHFGHTTVGATLEQFYVWDMIVHRWDIASSFGADAGFSAAELDRIEDGADSFGGALYMDGVCRPRVEAPAGADRTVRVLARLGRRA